MRHDTRRFAAPAISCTADEFLTRARELLALYRAVKGRDGGTVLGILRHHLGEALQSDVEVAETAMEVGATVFEGWVEEKIEGVRLTFARHVSEVERGVGTLANAPELVERPGLGDHIKDLSKVRLVEMKPHPATEKPTAPSSSWECPDLLSALYLQLYLMAIRHAPMRECAGCGEPFPLTNSKRKTCGLACRQRKRSREAAERG